MDPRRVPTEDGDIELCVPAAKRITVDVANNGDRPIQIGSHYHFAKPTPALKFGPAQSNRGYRLDVAAGTRHSLRAGQSQKRHPDPVCRRRNIYGFRAES